MAHGVEYLLGRFGHHTSTACALRYALCLVPGTSGQEPACDELSRVEASSQRPETLEPLNPEPLNLYLRNTCCSVKDLTFYIVLGIMRYKDDYEYEDELNARSKIGTCLGFKFRVWTCVQKYIRIHIHI